MRRLWTTGDHLVSSRSVRRHRDGVANAGADEPAARLYAHALRAIRTRGALSLWRSRRSGEPPRKGRLMPNRILSEAIRTDAARELLSDFEERLLDRLLVSADDYGRFDGRPAVIAAATFPLRVGERGFVRRVEKAIARLESAAIVSLYRVNGQPFLNFCEWKQQIRATKSKYPDPTPDDSGCSATDINCNQVQTGSAEAGSAPISISNNDSRITTSDLGSRHRVKTEWPEDFELNEAMRQYAIEHGIDPEVEFEHW